MFIPNENDFHNSIPLDKDGLLVDNDTSKEIRTRIQAEHRA